MLRFFVLCGLAACASPDFTDPSVTPRPPEPTEPDQPGAYDVGATTFSFTDSRGTALTIEIWYPGLHDDQAEPEDYGDFSVAWHAQRDVEANLRGAPYPIIAFSHGFGGVRYQSAFLTERLASHGFVVVAPDHPHGTLFDLDDSLTADVAVARPGDISATIDAVLALPAGHLAAGIAADGAVGMAGHSFGGWTAMAVGGGELDLQFAKEHCLEFADPGCGFIADLADLDSVEDANPDPRITATAALAPGGAYAFGPAGLESVANPLVIGGRVDADLPYDNEIRPVYDGLGTPKTMATLERAGHWGFTDLCQVIPTVVDCAGEAGGFMETAVVREVTMTLLTAHFRAALGGDDLGEWLTPARWDEHPDVTLEAE